MADCCSCQSDPCVCAETHRHRAAVASGVPMTLTTRSEIIFGGVRLDPGTYEIRRIDRPQPEDPPF